MSPEAREVFHSFLPNLSPEIKSGIHQDDFLWTPVGVREFCNDPHYLGSILHNGLYPQLLDDLEELFNGSYTEVCLAGSIGWGKSTMAEVGICYDIYLVSCLKEPAKTYGLLKGSNLAFLNASVREPQARRILFSGIGNLIRNSPYFQEKFPYDKNLLTELRFPRGVSAYPVAANEQSMLGEGVFSAVFDEINFYTVVEKSKQNPEGTTYDQATTLYNRMSRRLKSRLNSRGTLPGHLWMISSARYPNDFTERKAVEALSDKNIFVRQYSAWETKPKGQFMAETFRVEVGDITRRSRVLDGTETGINPERTIEVPMDFKEQFDKDPDAAVRDFAGIPVLSIRPFIGRRDLITEMMQKAKEDGLRHPFTAFTVTLQEEHEHLLPEYLDWVEESFDPKTKITNPRHLRNGPYYAHVDLSKTQDATGVGIVHVVGSKQVSRGLGKDKKYESRPIMRVDLALEIVAPLRGEIRISSVRELFYRLRDLGMMFGMISYDTWGSAESIQTLQGEGFSAEDLSVDRDAGPYETLKEAIYDGRLICYDMPVLAMELATVRRDDNTGKIDHLPNGKKDVSDAIAGAVWQAEKGWSNGAGSSQWAGVTGIASEFKFGGSDDNEILWDKVNRGIPLTEAEIYRLK